MRCLLHALPGPASAACLPPQATCPKGFIRKQAHHTVSQPGRGHPCSRQHAPPRGLAKAVLQMACTIAARPSAGP
eukprot:349934-Chlamydomonas_euryale.AAC.6